MLVLPGGPLPHAVSTVVVAPVAEPLTLAQAKLRAGLDWADGDPRDEQMRGFISAARRYVELRTGLALLEQTRDVFFDVLTLPVTLPMLCRPLQSVTSIKVTDSVGGESTIPPANYIVDVASGRIGSAPNAAWPYAYNLRSFQPWVIRVVAGFADPAALLAEEPALVQAVGVLTAHYATFGRDVASLDLASDVPHGFEDVLAAYLPVEVF